MPCQLSMQMYQSNLGFWILEMQVFYRENVTKIRTVDFLQSCRKMYNNKFYISLADPDMSLCLTVHSGFVSRGVHSTPFTESHLRLRSTKVGLCERGMVLHDKRFPLFML